MPDLAAQLQELKERFGAEDFVVEELDDDDPILRSVDGRIVDTWRESYPYQERISVEEYEYEKRLLQIELLKMQNWIKASGARLVILFEGRDAAGKGGTIKRFMEHLNPRHARVVALEKPTSRELRQWYFQRYIAHLPARGEITLFDRSWYTRAGVERVMGYCTRPEYAQFLRQAPLFEDLLVDEGFQLIKFWFSVTRGRAEHPVPDPADRPGADLEAVPHRPRLAGQVGRLHPGQGGHVPAHRYPGGAVDGRSRATTRSGPGSGRCATSWPAWTTTARTSTSSARRTPRSSVGPRTCSRTRARTRSPPDRQSRHTTL